MVNVSMLLIGERTPFEAALFADCCFVTEFMETRDKIGDLIGKFHFFISKTNVSCSIFQNCISCVFWNHSNDMKRTFLISSADKLHQMTGSIVIVCANEAEVKYVTGHLTQENVKCTDFDKYFSMNQMSKR